MSKIALCSFRKTGNYLFIKILKDILSFENKWKTYSISKNLWDKYFSNFNQSYPIEKEIDELVFLESNIWQLYKGSERIDIDEEMFNDLSLKSNFLLTHENPHAEIFKNPHTSSYLWFYLIRDVGPTLNSLIKFLSSADIVKRTPGYQILDPHELLNVDGYFEKCVDMWIEHVEQYFKFSKNFTLIKYEEIVSNKLGFINMLTKKTDFKGDPNKIIEDSSFSNMKKNAPNHVRSGDSKEYENFFSNKQIEYMYSKSFEIRKKIGYA